MNISRIVKAYLKKASEPLLLPIIVPPSLQKPPTNQEWVIEALKLVKKTYGLKQAVKLTDNSSLLGGSVALGPYGMVSYDNSLGKEKVEYYPTHSIPKYRSQASNYFRVKDTTLTPQEAWEIVYNGYSYLTPLLQAEVYLKQLQGVTGIAFDLTVVRESNDKYSVTYRAPSNVNVTVTCTLDDRGSLSEDVTLNWKTNAPETFFTFDELYDHIPEESDDLRILLQDKKYVKQLKTKVLGALDPLKIAFRVREYESPAGSRGLTFDVRGDGGRNALDFITAGDTWGGAFVFYCPFFIAKKITTEFSIATYNQNTMLVTVRFKDYIDADSMIDDIKKIVALRKGLNIEPQ